MEGESYDVSFAGKVDKICSPPNITQTQKDTWIYFLI